MNNIKEALKHFEGDIAACVVIRRLKKKERDALGLSTIDCLEGMRRVYQYRKSRGEDL